MKTTIIKRGKYTTIQTVILDGKEYVMKHYHQYGRQMLIEINILATSEHQNIIPMIKLMPLHGQMSIILPREKITLAALLEKKYIPIVDKINYLLQIAHGIKYLHQNYIMHMDLKSENIMITNKIAKIIDFGLAEYLFDNKLYTLEIKCTSTHRPPEGFSKALKKNFFVFDYSFDIWSFGIIMFEILSNTPMYAQPFIPKYNNPERYPEKEQEYEDKIYKFLISVEFTNEISDVLPEKLRRCLSHKSEDRPTIDSVINHLMEFRKKYTQKPIILDSRNTLKASLQIIPYNNSLNSAHKKYYQDFLQKIRTSYPDEFKHYSEITISATFDLINRIAIQSKSFNKKYVDQIILICHSLLHHNKIIPVEKIIKYDETNEIVNHIIIMANGILFQI